jgi:hypothetical protein
VPGGRIGNHHPHLGTQISPFVNPLLSPGTPFLLAVPRLETSVNPVSPWVKPASPGCERMRAQCEPYVPRLESRGAPCGL